MGHSCEIVTFGFGLSQWSTRARVRYSLMIIVLINRCYHVVSENVYFTPYIMCISSRNVALKVKNRLNWDVTEHFSKFKLMRFVLPMCIFTVFFDRCKHLSLDARGGGGGGGQS